MPTKKAYHHGDLRAALIQAGLRVLQKEGLGALSLRRVAREAEVSAMAPYRHFKDKQSLLAAISENGFVELFNKLEAAKSSHAGDMDEAGKAYLNFALKEPETYRLMFTQNVLCEGEKNESLQEAATASYTSLVETIEIGIEMKKIEPTISLDLAFTAWSLLHGIAMLVLDGILNDGPFGNKSPEDILTMCQAHFRSGWQINNQGGQTS
jgi:AcrR family transcriptional regulator